MAARGGMLRSRGGELHRCGNHAGCSCCNSRQTRRAQTHSLRQREKRHAQRRIQEES